MYKPNFKDAKGMVIDGVFSSEAIDSSGEVVKLDGLDISLFEEGQGTANYEHQGKEGMGKETVGHVIYAKKVYSLKDCEGERENFYYKKAGEVPYLYGMIRLYDGAGHESAKALAAQIRDHVAHDEQILVRYSVEGTTLERDSNIIKTSIGRKVACTIVPCNKTCLSGVLIDANAPEGYKTNPQDILKSEMLQDPLNKTIGGSIQCECNPILNDPEPAIIRLVKGLELLKAITAGSYDAVPSTLTGGAALQREDLGSRYREHIVSAIQDYDKPFDRRKFKEYLKDRLNKAALPDVSDSFLDHFMGIAEDYQIKKSEPVDLQTLNLYQIKHQYESLLIDLRKSIRDELKGYQITLPEIYLVQILTGKDQYSPAGRFIILDNQIKHLEDYHGILKALLPEGPVNPLIETTIQALKQNPVFNITESALPEAMRQQPVQNVQVVQQQVPTRPAVFHYLRPGMVKPHVVEFGLDFAAIDGQNLTEDELNLMLENARNGLASISWKTSASGGEIQQLAKAEEEGDSPLHAAMKALRAAVAAGHVDAAHEKALTNHIYTDSMVGGVGNKFATTDFLNKKKPGVYASIDLNNFKHINDRLGHPIGDLAIKAVGGAFRDAAAKVGNGFLGRNGGDEFVLHVPTHEDALSFLRHATNNINKIPHFGGIHKPSFSVGLGHDYETADKALFEAKKQKLDPTTGKSRYLPHNTPHFAHSLIPGSEGAVNMHNIGLNTAPKESKAA